jgi:hypothetical protein
MHLNEYLSLIRLDFTEPIARLTLLHDASQIPAIGMVNNSYLNFILTFTATIGASHPVIVIVRGIV